MGIDIYARWHGQSDEERGAQVTGFSIAHGHVGYLREAYHGGPYATRVLVPEAFEAPFENGAAIPAATLRERLPAAIATAIEREALVYKASSDSKDMQSVLQSLTDFVELCECKERETGEPCRIAASY